MDYSLKWVLFNIVSGQTISNALRKQDEVFNGMWDVEGFLLCM